MLLEIIGGITIVAAVFFAFSSGYCFGKADGLMNIDRPFLDKILSLPLRIIPEKWIHR